MSLDLTEPDQELAASVWEEVDAAYPNLETPAPDAEEWDIEAFTARETLRTQEFHTRYQAYRMAAIVEDRTHLSQEMQDAIQAWDQDSQTNPNQPNSWGRLRLGERERLLREWAADTIRRTTPSRESTRSQLRAQWDALSEQYHWLELFRDRFISANELLDEGKDAQAIEMIQRTPIPVTYNPDTEATEPVLTPIEITTFQSIKAQFVTALINLPS